MSEAVEEDVRLMSREERIASYRELVEGLESILNTHEPDNNAEEDAEQLALIEEVETQLRTLAKLLNSEETIQVTPGLMKKVEKSATTGEIETTIIYPPPPTASSSSSALSAAGSSSSSAPAAAPYQVFFDEREWFPCVITGVVSPENEVDRVQYRAWILGHNIEDVVYSELLRPWQAADTAAAEELQGGTACHVIHPRTGRYVDGVVDRLTLEGSVFVRVPADGKEHLEDGETAGATETVCVPLSHVRTGKFYAKLLRRPKNEEERAARRAEQIQLKRQRAAQERQNVAAKIAKEADDWQALMGDMMGMDGGGRAKKKRRTH